ncbi:MAG: hypothetical protein MSA15_12260 [Clostridium sp.]|nr:hypothetical protein [Clostridium sp.]
MQATQQFNPMQVIMAIRNGQNPQQIVMNMLQERMSQTPMGQNLITLAQNNQTAQIEQIARNICNQRGIDFDKEFNSFKDSLGIK